MDYQLIQFISQSPALLTTTYCIVIMLFSMLIAIYVPSSFLRSLSLVGLAIVVLSFAQGASSEYGKSFFNILMMELIGTFAVLVIFESGITQERTTFPFLAVGIVVVSWFFFLQPPFLPADVSLEFGVILMGAFITTVLLERDWWWTDKVGRVKVDEEFSDNAVNAAFQAALDKTDIHIRITSSNPAIIDKRIEYLQQFVTVIDHTPIAKIEDKKTEQVTYTNYIAALPRELYDDVSEIKSGEILLHLEGQAELIVNVSDQIRDALAVTSESPLGGPLQRSTMQFTVKPVEAQSQIDHVDAMQRLSHKWHVDAKRASSMSESQRASDSQKAAYLQGCAYAIKQAQKELVALIDHIEDSEAINSIP